MKKMALFIIATLIIMLSIIGYGYYKYKKGKDINVESTPKNELKVDGEKEEEKEYVDNNPIILSLYKNYRNEEGRKRIIEFSDNWTYHNDISSFEVYYTDVDKLDNGTQIELFNKYKEGYENVDSYKIGYIVEFSTNSNNYNKTILSPKDTEELFNYLEVYLYDDYHRNGEWYSHTTEETYTNETLLTSIKLTAGANIADITSDIKLTAFTYDSDDFDENGNYIGTSKYTITVKKAN